MQNKNKKIMKKPCVLIERTAITADSLKKSLDRRLKYVLL